MLIISAMTLWCKGFTCFLYAFASLVHVWEGKGKVTEPSAEIIAVLVIVLCQLQAEVCVLRSISQKSIPVLFLHVSNTW